MRENTDQNNSKYGHFSRNESHYDRKGLEIGGDCLGLTLLVLLERGFINLKIKGKGPYGYKKVKRKKTNG